MPKAPSRPAAAAPRHNPLADDILSVGNLRSQSVRKNSRKSRLDEPEDNRERFVDAKLSRKILQIGQELAEENAAEQRTLKGPNEEPNNAFNFDSRFDDEHLSDEEGYVDDQWDDEETEEVVSVSI